MAGFTPIVAGLDWQSIDFVNEIRTAIDERRQAMGPTTAMQLITAGQDLQRTNIYSATPASVYASINHSWQLYQEWLEWAITQVSTTYGWWIKDSEVIQGADTYGISSPTYTDPQPMTLNEWRYQAWGDTNGFRRATTWNPSTDDWTDRSDAMWSRPENGFGIQQAGDIIGPWIFDDLQKGISGLNRRFIYNTSGGSTNWLNFSNKYHVDEFHSDSDCATARTSFNTAWGASGWTAGQGTWFSGTARAGFASGSDSIFRADVWKGQPFCIAPSVSGITLDWEMFLTWYDSTTSAGLSNLTFEDTWGLGFLNGKWDSWDSGNSATGSVTSSNVVHDISFVSSIIDISPAITCPVSGTLTALGYAQPKVGLDIQWNWSHTV